ncbi:histone-lysine N-methyltransferase SETDB2 isoform 2-T2 [Spinachia spinachia]
MEENQLDPLEVERAKSFWAEEDVDQVFSGVFEYLGNLKRVLKKNTASDKEYVQGLKLLDNLKGPPASSQEPSVVQLVIGPVSFCPDEPLPAKFSHLNPSPSNGTSCSAAPPSGREERLPPPTPVQLQYEPHPCCKACLPIMPIMPQCTPAFWGQNPLKVPLLCGFKRLSAVPPMSSLRGSDEGAEQPLSAQEEDWDVLYKAPCGQSLRNHDDVMRFLLATESYDVLQVDFFTFNALVQLDPPSPTGPRCPVMDLSRGLEPTPVQLCVSGGGARPAEFRYRKDRWPHGCFLSRGPALFQVCCDCSDGCSDAQRCACAAATTGGRHYRYHRLPESVPSGVYECGPWCGCVRSRCQNRLVQRGIRVRLKVFQTDGRGWGVCCRDDMDRGTFVCIYAGITLQKGKSSEEPSPSKLTRTELPSDDEVEVVTEWPPPLVLESRNTALEPPQPTSPPLHTPVIRRPVVATPPDREQTVLVGVPEPPSCESGDPAPPLGKDLATTTETPVSGVNRTETERSLKRLMEAEDVYFLDASKEGNVSRFINHSCSPNLFVQNVFTDCHDSGFPVVAFFTSTVVKAGSELTWKYSTNYKSKQNALSLH